MLLEVLKLLAGAVLGAICATIGLVYANQKSKPIEMVEYTKDVMPLLQFTPKRDSEIHVFVEEKLLSIEQHQESKPIEIFDAFGIMINLKNTGSVGIGEHTIEIQLEKHTKIIKSEIFPLQKLGTNAVFYINPLNKSKVAVTIPYLKKQEELIIRIISTGNRSAKCELEISGVNTTIKEQKIEPYYNKKFLSINMYLVFGLVTIYVVLVPFIYLLPVSTKETFGWIYLKDLQPPMWYIIPPFCSLLWMLGSLTYILNSFHYKKKLIGDKKYWQNDFLNEAIEKP